MLASRPEHASVSWGHITHSRLILRIRPTSSLPGNPAAVLPPVYGSFGSDNAFMAQYHASAEIRQHVAHTRTYPNLTVSDALNPSETSPNDAFMHLLINFQFFHAVAVQQRGEES
jgi:hypothetical protein